jgi:hypothetical protein
MPLSQDNIIQSASGTFDGGSCSPTLPAGTTAGSTVLIVGYLENSQLLAPTPGTWNLATSDPGGGSNGAVNAYLQRNVAGGETTWTQLADGTSGLGCWAIYEIAGVGSVDIPEASPWYMSTDAGSIGNPGSTTTSDTTGFVPGTVGSTTDCYDALGVAVFGAKNPSSATVPVFSGYSAGLQEILQISNPGTGKAVAMAICLYPVMDFGRFNASVSVSPTSYQVSDIFFIYADNARYTQKFDAMTGFEFGTATGITNGSEIVVGVGPFDGSVGTPEVVTTFKRSGNYALKLSSTAAAEAVTWADPGVLGIFDPKGGAKWAAVARLHFYFDTSLPSADVELCSIEAGSLANGMVLWYRSASQKIGVKIGTGTEVLSDAVVAVDKWVGVDLRYAPGHSFDDATHKVDWQVDYDSLDSSAAPVAQTAATATGLSYLAPTTFRLGWTTSHTATVYYDDIFLSKQWGTYPIGDTRIAPLKVDPAGTPTISGTSTNFQTYASNGTGTAWNATTARNAVDDIPPTVGASSDGAMQVSVAANDYMEFPMDTFAGAPNYALRAIRWYIAGWASSGNPATLRVLSNDGTDDLFSVALNDHGFDSSTLRWLCGMQRKVVSVPAGFSPPHYPLTQAKLDALSIRVGFSTDANPDVGIHAILAEVAYQPVDIYGSLGIEGDAFKLYVRQDPVSQAVVSYQVATPSGSRGATFSWTISGVDGSQYVGPNTTWEKNVGSISINDVTSISLLADPA